MTTVVATPGQGPDRPQEVSYTDTKIIGNGSFGVVFQAKLCDTGELVAIKKVLQDKRFKVRPNIYFYDHKSNEQWPVIWLISKNKHFAKPMIFITHVVLSKIYLFRQWMIKSSGYAIQLKCHFYQWVAIAKSHDTTENNNKHKITINIHQKCASLVIKYQLLNKT